MTIVHIDFAKDGYDTDAGVEWALANELSPANIAGALFVSLDKREIYVTEIVRRADVKAWPIPDSKAGLFYESVKVEDVKGLALDNDAFEFYLDENLLTYRVAPLLLDPPSSIVTV